MKRFLILPILTVVVLCAQAQQYRFVAKVTKSRDCCMGISSSESRTRCYFAGKVSGNFLCEGTYTYFDSTVSGKSGTNGRSTAEMMKQTTFESWDFKNTWKITEGKNYLTLRCFDE